MPGRIAVVDLGTNSSRLLIADVRGGGVEELVRRSTVTRLGEGVDESGRLGAAAIGRVVAALASYRELIDEHGSPPVVAVATSAVRDAENGADLRDLLRERYSIDPQTIPGEEEARLTFLGATAGRPDRDTETLVIDIGGGSTEFVTGPVGGEPGFHVSTQLGTVRHSERHITTDPPEQREIDELAAGARAIVAREVPEELRQQVERGIAVAGTPTSLAAIDQRLEPYDPERVQGHVLTLAAVERMLGELAAVPLEERQQIPGLHPDRAATIVPGAAILLEAMRAFGLDRIEASEADILHGAALDAVG